MDQIRLTNEKIEQISFVDEKNRDDQKKSTYRLSHNTIDMLPFGRALRWSSSGTSSESHSTALYARNILYMDSCRRRLAPAADHRTVDRSWAESVPSSDGQSAWRSLALGH